MNDSNFINAYVLTSLSSTAKGTSRAETWE